MRPSLVVVVAVALLFAAAPSSVWAATLYGFAAADPGSPWTEFQAIDLPSGACTPLYEFGVTPYGAASTIDPVAGAAGTNTPAAYYVVSSPTCVAQLLLPGPNVPTPLPTPITHCIDTVSDQRIWAVTVDPTQHVVYILVGIANGEFPFQLFSAPVATWPTGPAGQQFWSFVAALPLGVSPVPMAMGSVAVWHPEQQIIWFGTNSSTLAGIRPRDGASFLAPPNSLPHPLLGGAYDPHNGTFVFGYSDGYSGCCMTGGAGAMELVPNDDGSGTANVTVVSFASVTPQGIWWVAAGYSSQLRTVVSSYYWPDPEDYFLVETDADTLQQTKTAPLCTRYQQTLMGMQTGP